MAKLELEFVGFKQVEGNIAVDGKIIKFKKNKNKTYSYVSDGVSEKCEIVVYKTHNYIGKNWFWWNLLYFFVSMFGLFDIKQNKKCLVFDGRFCVDVKEDTRVVIRRQNFENGGKLFLLETSSEVEETSNVQYYDKEAKKKHRKMKKFKLATTIIAMVLTIALIVLL